MMIVNGKINTSLNDEIIKYISFLNVVMMYYYKVGMSGGMSGKQVSQVLIG